MVGGCYDIAKRNTNGIPRHSVNGISKKFRRMSELYHYFGKEMGSLDFSDEALLSLYNHESYGTPLSLKNGFAVGKQYLNVHVTMYKEDIALGSLFKFELYEWFPTWHWWLDGWLKGVVQGYP